MKHLILMLALALSINAFAQDADKTVTLVVSAQGKTQDEAKQVALRSAIEQAFGAFISSKTEIINDKLVKDEIVSVSNGNIQGFEIISIVQIPNGSFSITLQVTVSVSKLTSFVESKGFEVEFKGGLFAANIKQKLLEEEAERIAIFNLCDVSWKILSESIDYELVMNNDPILINKEDQIYNLPILIKAKTNSNKAIFNKYFSETIIKLSISEGNLKTYETSNIPTFSFKLFPSDKIIHLRNRKSLIALKNLILWSNKFYLDFKLISNIDSLGIFSPFNVRVPPEFKGRMEETNLFDLGFNSLNDKESNRNALIESINNSRIQHSPFDLFESIISKNKERVKKITNFQNIFSSELLWESCDCDYYDFYWYGHDNYEYDNILTIIIDDRNSALDICINKTFNLAQLEKFTGYKIIKSPILIN
jgi:hypothetical protein